MERVTSRWGADVCGCPEVRCARSETGAKGSRTKCTKGMEHAEWHSMLIYLPLVLSVLEMLLSSLAASLEDR